MDDFLRAQDSSFQLNDEEIRAIDEAGAKLHFRQFWQNEIDGKKEEL
jgi:hypothetical protein